MKLSHGAGFWVVAATFLVSMAFSTIPTALYALYQDRDGFPAVVITLIFAAYAVGVVGSLFFIGHVSDWVGRRRVIILSLAIQLVSVLLFLLWPEVPGLILARIVNGVGIGAITATATVHLSELAARHGTGPSRAAVVATLVNMGGLGLGLLVGGLFATWAAEPLAAPFLSFGVIFVLLTVAIVAVPETVERPDPTPRYRPQRVSLPAGSRGSFWAAALAAFGAFSVLGLFAGLSPSFLAGSLQESSHLLAGAVPSAVFISGAVAQILVTRLTLVRQLRLAIGLVAVGLTGVATGALLAQLWLFISAGVIAGAGVGILFRSALATAGALAEPERRGETLAATFLVGYAGLIVPILGAGAALLVLPANLVLVAFSAVVIALVAVTGGRMLRRARGGQ